VHEYGHSLQDQVSPGARRKREGLHQRFGDVSNPTHRGSQFGTRILAD
jgi:hypothetical protein